MLIAVCWEAGITVCQTSNSCFPARFLRFCEQPVYFLDIFAVLRCYVECKWVLVLENMLAWPISYFYDAIGIFLRCFCAQAFFPPVFSHVSVEFCVIFGVSRFLVLGVRV